MFRSLNKNVWLILIIAYGLYSCSITTLPSGVQKSIKQSSNKIDKDTAQIKNAKNLQHNNYITHTSVGYFGNHVITENNSDFLPPKFNNTIQIDKEFTDLNSISSSLTDLTRIPTVLDLSTTRTNSICTNIRITQQSGDLIDLLNLIGSKCDIGWDYRDGKIVLFDTETRTWSIRGIPGDIQVQSQIQNNSGAQSQIGSTGGISTGVGGGGSGGGAPSTSQSQVQQSATQNTAYNLSNNLWKNLQDAIKLQLSKIGRLSISPSTSSITVTDKPSVISRVGRYIREQNNKLKRMVIIDVQLINVDVTAEDNYGVNWQAVLGGEKSRFSINGQQVSNGMSSTTSGKAGTFSPTPVFIPTNTTQAFTLEMTSGSLSGSQFLINALSTKARSSLVTSTAVSTLSNQPVPLQFVDQQAYLASVSNVLVANAGTQTSLTPGQLTTGFSLNLLPVVEKDNRVDLQISINISALKGISQFSSNGSSIQLPNTLQRNFMQKVVIKSGDTFVITGFDSDNQSILNTGVGSATNWWLGGGVSANRKRTRMVMLITPTVVNI